MSEGRVKAFDIILNRIAAIIAIFVFFTGIPSAVFVYNRYIRPAPSESRPTTTVSGQSTTTIKKESSATSSAQPNSTLRNQSKPTPTNYPNAVQRVNGVASAAKSAENNASGSSARSSSASQDNVQPLPASNEPELAKQCDLTGRWNGPWGDDNQREVLHLSGELSGSFTGCSYFEGPNGQIGEGNVSGTISGSYVEFTLVRDGGTFHWVGSLDSNQETLVGHFRGHSNGGPYARQ